MIKKGGEGSGQNIGNPLEHHHPNAAAWQQRGRLPDLSLTLTAIT